MNEQFSIAGKVAVITGAGGVLGCSIAKCFMEQGAKDVYKRQMPFCPKKQFNLGENESSTCSRFL